MLSNFNKNKTLGTKLRNSVDNLILGILIGIIVPLILLFVIYENNLKSIYLSFITRKMLYKEIFPAIFNWCVLPNILFFMIALSFNINKTAKGLLFITIVETIIIFVLKFAL